MKLENTVKDFKEYLAKIQHYNGIAALLSFYATSYAPPGAAETLAKRMGFVSGEMFAMVISPQMKNFLDELTPNLDKVDEITAAMYRVCKRNYDKNANIPVEKIVAFKELTAKSHNVWEKARKENDFATFAPYLKDVIAAQKDMLNYKPSTGNPLESLMDDYYEGLTTEFCDDFFTKLRDSIVLLLQKVSDSPKKTDHSWRFAPVPLDKQKEISVFIADKIGFDLNCGIVAQSAHPYCNSSNKYDVRLTTRYFEKDFLASFFAVLHECGHGIYEQNTRDSIGDTVLDRGLSSVHESQSRFYENYVGRSPQFWEYMTEPLKAYLPQEFSGITSDMFYRGVNVVEPSLIRVEADELTYSLHIILRYEMEKLLFDGDVDIKELPQIWNQKTKDYLGLTPPNDSDGIMQDVHWSEGLMGYFPTYTLGSAYSAQLLNSMEKEMDVFDLVKKGDFAPLTKWMTDKIHNFGSLLPTEELLTQATGGSTIDIKYYIDYLEEKFSQIYELR